MQAVEAISSFPSDQRRLKQSALRKQGSTEGSAAYINQAGEKIVITSPHSSCFNPSEFTNFIIQTLR